MSTRRHVIMFKPRFAVLVEAGQKRTTIRPPRKRQIHLGDQLSLREWRGLPYRSKQRELRKAIVTRVDEIVITRANGAPAVTCAGVVLIDWFITNLARGDGFGSSTAMVAWFEEVHGLPFHGQIIEWRYEDETQT